MTTNKENVLWNVWKKRSFCIPILILILIQINTSSSVCSLILSDVQIENSNLRFDFTPSGMDSLPSQRQLGNKKGSKARTSDQTYVERRNRNDQSLQHQTRLLSQRMRQSIPRYECQRPTERKLSRRMCTSIARRRRLSDSL
jgi:hypothetical protein